MRTSFYLTCFITLLLCVVFPLYLALRASAWLSDVGSLLSPLSERTKALHVALTSPLTAPCAPKPFTSRSRPRLPPLARQSPKKPSKLQPSPPDPCAHPKAGEGRITSHPSPMDWRTASTPWSNIRSSPSGCSSASKRGTPGRRPHRRR